MALHIQTPFIESIPMGLPIGKKVYLKLENIQKGASFKIRGIGALCEHAHANGAKKFVCATTSNAGYALAWAGRDLGVPAVICAPETMPKEAIEAIEMLGQQVTIHGKTWYDADDLARKMESEDSGTAYISTNDHPLIWSGISTIIDEIAATGIKPDAVICSVGSGGMISGLAEGMERHGWHDTALIGCGTYGANAYSETVLAGAHVELPSTSSIIPCISALYVVDEVLAHLKKRKLEAFLTSDLGAVTACERFLDDHRMLVDPSCGVALASVYENTPHIRDMETIALIVCGGVGIKPKKLARMKALAIERERK